MTRTGPVAPELRRAGPDRVDGREVVCRIGAGELDLGAHHAIRHAVFVREQAVFDTDDRDGRDGATSTLHVLGLVDGLPAGAVRLYPVDPLDPTGDWQGDRLAVLPAFRSHRVGGPLVEYAVATAALLGGRRMIAHVQPVNGTFFRRLGWRSRGEELYVGRPHLLMDIDLTR